MTVKCSRKYDVNDEAQKLYKTDFQNVLQRFRRTPEYQKILEEKKMEQQEFSEEAFTQIMFRYKVKLSQRLQEMFELEKYSNPSTKPASKAYFRVEDKARRNEEESTKDPGIAKLDKYNKFYGKLTLKERNHMKELGFEYAGHVIHALIRAMGPEDIVIKSTRQSYYDDDGDEKKKKKKKTEPTTTEHVKVHEITSTTEKKASDETMSTVTEPTPQYYYRQRQDDNTQPQDER